MLDRKNEVDSLLAVSAHESDAEESTIGRQRQCCRYPRSIFPVSLDCSSGGPAGTGVHLFAKS